VGCLEVDGGVSPKDGVMDHAHMACTTGEHIMLKKKNLNPAAH
jgi:hypothetical protein